MKIGYQEEEYQIYTNQIEDGIYLKENIFYIYTKNDSYVSEEVSDFIDIRKIVYELNVSRSLEGIFIYGNQEEVLNIDILKLFTNLKIINIQNVEVSKLAWLMHLVKIESFTCSSTLGYEKGVMQDSFYHPIKYLRNVNYLDVSFSRFSETAIYLTDKSSIFDNMENLEYLNVRETNLSSTFFFITKREGYSC